MLKNDRIAIFPFYEEEKEEVEKTHLFAFVDGAVSWSILDRVAAHFRPDLKNHKGKTG